MITVLLILIAYVLGSIPNALWVGKTFKNIDVREHGSKNTGSTNAARVFGAKLGIFTLIAIMYSIGHREYKKKLKNGTLNEDDLKWFVWFNV